MMRGPRHISPRQAMAALRDFGLSFENIATAGTDMDFFKENVRFLDLNSSEQQRQQLEVMQCAVELLKYVWASCVPSGSEAPSLNVVRSLICNAVSGVGICYVKVALRECENLRRACAAAEEARFATLDAVKKTLVARPGFKDSEFRKGGAPGFNDTTDVKWRAYTLACVHLVARTKALIVALSEAQVQYEAWGAGQAGPTVFAAACGGYPLDKTHLEITLFCAPAVNEETLLKAMRGMHRHAPQGGGSSTSTGRGMGSSTFSSTTPSLTQTKREPSSTQACGMLLSGTSNTIRPCGGSGPTS